jgi:putative cell wall-binding protein
MGGADRIGTAVLTAQMGWATAKTVVITRADNYADALAGSALAAQAGGPLLLTDSGGLDPRTEAELTHLLSGGATVYILGGPSAVSPAVDARISALGLHPQRLQGSDRFATAVAVARQIATIGPISSVLVATGQNFPDALTAGAAAAAGAAPNTTGVVLLTDDTTMPQATAAFLSDPATSAAAVFGVGDQGVGALATVRPTSTFTAVTGPTRFETAAAVARRFFPAKSTLTVVGLATGANWPDALSGGAFMGATRGPLLLADGSQTPTAEAQYTQSIGANIIRIVAFGGPAVLPDQALTQVGSAAAPTASWVYHYCQTSAPC